MIVKAYAKLNLTLDICGKRPDGYHLLDSVMQSVGLFDTLSVEPAAEITVLCSEPNLNGADNICYRAATAFFDSAGIDGGVYITVEKHIPQAAGMGGGSADAAAVIGALNYLYHTDFKAEKLCEIAASVGADVPFCLLGGTARVGGIGEKTQPLRPLPDCFIVGFKDGEKQSTGEMYRRIDDCNFSFAQTEKAVSAINRNDLTTLLKTLSNDFLSVTDHADTIKEFIDFGAIGSTLTGSGPTVFGIFNSSDDAELAFEHFSACGKHPFLTRPVNCGIAFE